MRKKAGRAIAFVLASAVMVAATLGLSKGKASEVNAAYSTPRLIVTGCDINGGNVKAGSEFDMTIHLRNESDSTKLTNIKLKLSSEANQIVPVSGSDSIYIDTLGKEEETDVTVKMKAKEDLEQKTYTVNVDYAYENSWGKSFDDSASLAVPVVQESKIGLSEIKLTKSEVELNGKTSISFKVNNLGLDKLRNVTVEFSGDTIKEISYFVGTIESGQSGSVDMTITPDKIGSDDIHIKVTYEDILGKSNTMQDSTGFTVKEETTEEEAAVTPEAKQAGIPVGPIAIVVAVIAVIGVIVNIVKKNRMKKYQ